MSPAVKKGISIGVANRNTRTMPGKEKMGHCDGHGGR
jgi:hypothetical protein